MTPEEMIREHRQRHNVMAGHYWPELADQMAAEIKRLRFALTVIKKMKPTEIADGFVHGPALLFSNCQRVARDALRGIDIKERSR